jgi:hypothetical protein
MPIETCYGCYKTKSFHHFQGLQNVFFLLKYILELCHSCLILAACSVCSGYFAFIYLITDRSIVNSPLSGMSGEWGMPFTWICDCMWNTFTEATIKSNQHRFA